MVFLTDLYIKNLKSIPNFDTQIWNELFASNLLNRIVDRRSLLLGEGREGYPDLTVVGNDEGFELVQCDLPVDLDLFKISRILFKHNYSYKESLPEIEKLNLDLRKYYFSVTDNIVVSYGPTIMGRAPYYFLPFFQKNIMKKLHKLRFGFYKNCREVSLVINAMCRHKTDGDVQRIINLYKESCAREKTSFTNFFVITSSALYSCKGDGFEVTEINGETYRECIDSTLRTIDLVKRKETLFSFKPSIAIEWDFSKNAKTPLDYGGRSGEKCWWICPLGHSYDATIAHRTTRNHGCPYCSGHRVLRGFNDLQTTHPFIAKQWHPTLNGEKKPSSFSKGSMERIWWLCPNGHAYCTRILLKNEKNDCPYCNHKVVLQGQTDLASRYPEVAMEWDYTKNGSLKPTDVFPKSTKKVWWLCPQGHSYRASIGHRTTEKTGCPICNKEHKVSFAEKLMFFYLQKSIGEVLENYNGGLPRYSNIDIFLPAYKVGIEYDGAHWHKSAKRDNEKNENCKKLGIRLIRIREKGCPQLNSSSYDFYVEAGNYLMILEALRSALKEVCNCPFSFDFNLERDTPLIERLILNKTKENTIANNDRLLAEWDSEKNGGIDPKYISSGSDKKYFWKCDKGHTWAASPSNRRRGDGCPYCANRLLLKGYNDLATTNHKLLSEWDYEKNDKKPDEVMKGSAKKAWWICPKGHSYQIEIREKKENYCPVCQMNIIQEGVNDFVTMYPEIAKEWDYSKNEGINPHKLSPFSIKKVSWVCHKCGYVWEQRICRRTKEGKSCPRCSVTGMAKKPK